MCDDKDELIERLGMGISRRKMLKGMGYGLTGAIIAPSLIESVLAAPRRATRSLSDATPTLIWDAKTPPNYSIWDAPLLNQGTVIVSADVAGNYDGVLYCLDTQTRETRWSHTFDHFIHTPLSVGGVLYAAADGGDIYSIDPESGNILWQKPYHAASKLRLIGGNLVFTTTDGHVTTIDLQGDLVWQYDLGRSVTEADVSQAVASGGTVIVLTRGGLIALDLNTGARLWNHNTSGESVADPSVGGGNVYINDPNGVYAIDILTGNEVWRWQQGANPIDLTAAFSYGGVVYVGDAGGRLRALQQNSGSVLWEVGVNQSMTFPGGNRQIFFEDGIAYFAAGTSFRGEIFAVDLKSQGEKIVSYNPNAGDVAAGVSIIGIETGVCYFQQLLGEGYLSAVNMAGIIHQYFCESELMVEDYQGSSSHPNGYQGNTSSYRTHVQLVDENKNPRANKSVKVWASDAVTISSGGTSYNLNPLNPSDPTDTTTNGIWLTTDASGELSLVSSAATISSPALYLWGNFMELDEAIVIYPDHDTLSTLSTMQGSVLAGAKGFDDAPMLPSGYAGTEDLASTIRNTMGGGAAQAMFKTREKHRQALAKKRRTKKRWSVGAAAVDTYISYPASTTNMIYQPIVGDAGRTYVQGAIPQWTATFDDAGNVSFQPGASLEGPELLGSFLGDLKKLGHDVVNTAVKVSKVVWDDVQKVVKVFVNAAGDFYHDVADTIEKAVAVVAGALKTVIGDIKKAVQWLSYLFDWEDMLAVKNQLKTVVNQKFSDLKTWTNNQIANDVKDVHNFFVGMESTLLNTLGQGQTAIGGPNMQSRQVNNNDPQSGYGMGGSKSYSKSRYLTTKYTANAPNGSVGAPGAAAASDPSATLVSLMGQLRTTFSDIINNTSNNPDYEKFKAIPGDALKVISDFSLLVTDPSRFIEHSFTDIINLITDIAVTLIQLVDAAVEAFLKLLGQIIDAVISLVNQPIHIPVLTDIWNLITHDPLTVLDLICWMVAVPTTIVQKVVGGARDGDANKRAVGGVNSTSGIVLNQNIGYLFAAAFNMVLDPFMDVMTDIPRPLTSGYMALQFTLLGLNFPTDLASNTATDYIFYAAQVFPIFATGVDMGFGLKYADADFTKVVWDAVLPVINTCYGVGMFSGALWLGFEGPPSFQGKDYLTLIQNLFSFTPFMAKFLNGFGEEAKIALGVIDGVCDATVFGLQVAQMAEA